MIIIHPKQLRLIENIILTSLTIIVFFIAIYSINSKKQLELNNPLELILYLLIITIFIGSVYKYWNPKFLSFEKSIFEEDFFQKNIEFDNNIFILDDYKIVNEDNFIIAYRFGNNFSIEKSVIDLKSKTLKHKPFEYLSIYTQISLGEIDSFDVVFRPNKRFVLIYNTKYDKNFELKTLILNPLSWQNKYPERKKEAKKLVNYLNNLL